MQHAQSCVKPTGGMNRNAVSEVVCRSRIISESRPRHKSRPKLRTKEHSFLGPQPDSMLRLVGLQAAASAVFLHTCARAAPEYGT